MKKTMAVLLMSILTLLLFTTAIAAEEYQNTSNITFSDARTIYGPSTPASSYVYVKTLTTTNWRIKYYSKTYDNSAFNTTSAYLYNCTQGIQCTANKPLTFGQDYTGLTYAKSAGCKKGDKYKVVATIPESAINHTFGYQWTP